MSTTVQPRHAGGGGFETDRGLLLVQEENALINGMTQLLTGSLPIDRGQ
ncbi:MAG: hypothetical protein OXH60_02350 [Rhodospirillales bacterium]|nr:hypothetical protein [Rhodospirillales bacterium]